MTESTLAIRGARMLVNGELRRRDILVAGGRIAKIDRAVDAEAPTLDASGLVALPGAIDAHVHFREPGATHKEDWASGSRAALAGGVTTVLDMPNTTPPTTSAAALADKRRLASASSLVDWGLFFGLTERNLAEALAAQGIAGIKVYLGSSTGGLLVLSDATLDGLFAAYGGTVVVHAEDERLILQKLAGLGHAPLPLDHGRIRDVPGALEAVRRALEPAARHGGRLHVAHVSSPDEVEAVVRARAEGVRVTCEVTPHHLLLDESFVVAYGARGKVNPPLRPLPARDALWELVRAGAVDLVATDHAPHLLSEKDLAYPQAAAGLPSVELLLPLLLESAAERRLSLSDVVRLSSEAPARAFGIERKGRLEPEHDADIVLVDLLAVRSVNAAAIRSRCGWSPYAGRRLRGWPVYTLVRGHVAFGPSGYDASRRGREVTFRSAR
jgi:dihydroorotase